MIVLQDQARILRNLAKTKREQARQLYDEANALMALSKELQAVAMAVTGTNNSQPSVDRGYYPQPIDLNYESNHSSPDGGTYYLRVGLNQAKVISDATWQAANGKTVALQYPDGTMLVLTKDNYDRIPIPHATEQQ